jgi:polar amino acid transport system substrate-binding protein
VWSNITSTDKARFPIELLKTEIAQAIEQASSFRLKRLLNNADTWLVLGLVLDGEEEPLLLVASNITESVRQQDEALTANRMTALGNMAANIVHEINNPLGLIMHNIDFLQKLTQDMYTFIDTQQTDVRFAGFSWEVAKAEGGSAQGIITKNIQRIIDTVADLRSFSKKRDTIYTEIDLARCINNAIRYTSYFIKHYTVNFRCNLAKSVPPVQGYEQQIEQVVVNLIQNACYALTNNTQAITCSLALSDDARHAVITVEDEGRGMSEIVKMQAFEAFFTTRENGTGLGLSIVANIVKEHNGHCTVESEEGKGTKVAIHLPVG